MRYADAGGVRIASDDQGPRADAAVVCLPGRAVNRGLFAAIACARELPAFCWEAATLT